MRLTGTHEWRGCCWASLFLLAGASGSSPANASANAAPIDVVRDCGASASPALTGIDALAKVCPDLSNAIGALGVDQVLHEGWRDRLSVFQLRDLAAIAERYAAVNARAALDTQTLAEVLQGLKSHTTPARSWWDSLKNWWHEWLARSDSALAKWLRQISDHVGVSQGVLRAWAYGLAAAVAAAAAILVARELQLWNRRRRARAPARPMRMVAAEGMAQPIATPAPGDAQQRLGQLLRALVERLSQTGRLTAGPSLTHRELADRTKLDHEDQRRALSGVTRVAEAVLFGPQGAVQAEVPGAIERGEALLAQLEALPR